MSVSLYSNEYVARIEKDRSELLSWTGMLIHEYEDAISGTDEASEEMHALVKRINEPLPPRRNSASNNA